MSSIVRRAGSKLSRLIARAAAPAFEAGRVLSYARSISGVAQLFELSSDGQEYQRTGIDNHQFGVQSVGIGVAGSLIAGAARGLGAADLQCERTGAAQVASGAQATVSGRRCTGSGTRSLAIGDACSASANGAVSLGLTCVSSTAGSVALGSGSTASGPGGSYAIGSGSIATGLQSVALGSACTASGATSFAVGDLNTASGTNSVATGNRSLASRQGQRSHANGMFAATGDAQLSDVVFRRLTTDATPSELTLNGAAPLGTNRFIMVDSSKMTCEVDVVGSNLAADEGAWYKFVFGASRAAGAASTRVVGVATTTIFEDVAAWDAAVTADVVNGAIIITVTGEAGKSIRWTATMRFTEVRTA